MKTGVPIGQLVVVSHELFGTQLPPYTRVSTRQSERRALMLDEKRQRKDQRASVSKYPTPKHQTRRVSNMQKSVARTGRKPELKFSHWNVNRNLKARDSYKSRFPVKATA